MAPCARAIGPKPNPNGHRELATNVRPTSTVCRGQRSATLHLDGSFHPCSSSDRLCPHLLSEVVLWRSAIGQLVGAFAWNSNDVLGDSICHPGFAGGGS